jgi:nucleoprotein TPR
MKLQQQLQSQAKVKGEHEAAIKAAVEKATSAASVSSTATATAGEPSANVIARHAEELRALEQRLHKEHEAALKKAVEDAAQGVDSAATLEKVLQERLAEKTAELKKAHEEELAKATENGLKEGSLKMKMKDAQLIKVQTKIRQFEAKIQEWVKDGKLPGDALSTVSVAPATSSITPAAPLASAPATSASAAPAPKSAPTPPAPTSASSSAPVPTSAPLPAAPVTRATAAARGGAPGGMPRKPAPATAATPAGAGRGRGRGAARGGGVSTRGAAPNAAAAAAAAAGPAGNGVSIMGAAAKRPREDGEAASDSLAKRLKPAETGAQGKPVQLNRNRTGTTPQS